MQRSEQNPAPGLAAARLLFAYLSETDPRPAVHSGGKHPCDAIMGFGVFDRRLPRFCGELYHEGIAPHIIFTGGIGAGTGDLGGPEADVWHDELHDAYPDIPDSALILENRSTNTAENISFTARLLAGQHPHLIFGTGIKRLAVVASPSRLRRVCLTLRQQQPTLEIFRVLPAVNFDTECALYARNGVDYVAHLAGEVDRILDYPRRGWIVAEPLPERIVEAHGVLRGCIASSKAHHSPS